MERALFNYKENMNNVGPFKRTWVAGNIEILGPAA